MNKSDTPVISNRLLAAIFICVALVCAAALLLINGISGSGCVAVVAHDGAELYRIDLSTVTQEYTLEVGGCTLLVEHGQISVCDSDCPDKLCVHQGVIENSAGSIVCLPNKVMIYIVSDNPDAPDAVVG